MFDGVRPFRRSSTEAHRVGIATRLVRNAALVLLLGAGPTFAAEGGGAPVGSVVDARLRFTAGGFLTDFDTAAAVGSGSLLGTIIQVEDDLQVQSDQDVFRTDGFYRFNENQAIGFGFWTLNRSGSAILDEEIEFDGETYVVDAQVRSQFDTSWLRVEWRYSMLRTDRGEAGVTVGLSLYDFDLGLSGEVSVGMGNTAFESASESFLAPVPTLGFFLNRALGQRWNIALGANFFNLEVDDYDGRLVDTVLAIEWQFSRPVGFGFGLNSTNIDFQDQGEDPLQVDYQQDGLMAYVTFRFGRL